MKKLLTSVLAAIMLFTVIPTKVLAEEENNTDEQSHEEIVIPDTFTYFENGTMWKVSNFNDLKNVKVEILYKISLRHGPGCLPGDPGYPTCDGNYGGNTGGVAPSSAINDFIRCVFKKSAQDLGLDLLGNVTLKALEITFKKFGKGAVAKKLASAIPGNTAYWTAMAIKNVYACALNL
ncbi:MAG: hypothetical protein MR601_04710 [Erysipelotrichaceae bacterium]|nr:hypothetical protein [Erysipelotrichaceae bacterium]